MRTTIELPDALYRRLRTAAADRGVRALSPIVAAALDEYLAGEEERRSLVAAIEAAEGAWTEEDLVELERARRRAWSEWHIDPSSTQTS